MQLFLSFLKMKPTHTKIDNETKKRTNGPTNKEHIYIFHVDNWETVYLCGWTQKRGVAFQFNWTIIINRWVFCSVNETVRFFINVVFIVFHLFICTFDCFHCSVLSNSLCAATQYRHKWMDACMHSINLSRNFTFIQLIWWEYGSLIDQLAKICCKSETHSFMHMISLFFSTKFMNHIYQFSKQWRF